MRTAARQSMVGYTMMELVVTMAIVAILVSLAGPSFTSVTNSNRIAGEVNGLLGDLQYARAEAVKEGLPVTVCASTNGTACSGGNTWQGGWIVFADANGNAAVDAGEAILRVQQAFRSTDTFVASNAVAAITFNREGFANGFGAGSLFSLHDATTNVNWTRCLSINVIGLMVTQKKGEIANGVTCS